MNKEIQKNQGSGHHVSYKITVEGMLSEYWEYWFNGSQISIEYGQEGKPHTTLTCQVRDQAELFGILNQLHNLNLFLLQVTLF